MEPNQIKYYAQTLSSGFKWLELYILSDVHYGNPFCNVKDWLWTLDYLAKTPNAYVILNGDLCESALKTSKGDIYRQVGTPQDQRDWQIKQLLPLKGKVLGMTAGNHEDRIYNDAGMDISRDIATALGCPYDPDAIAVKISFGNGNDHNNGRPFVYYVYCSHGWGGARTRGAKSAKVERQGHYVFADIHAMSHDHEVNVSPDTYLNPDPRTSPEKDEDGNETGFTIGRYTAHRTELVKTNAFVMWGGYSRKYGFSPSDLVTPTIWLAGEEKPWPMAKKNNKPEVRVVA